MPDLVIPNNNNWRHEWNNPPRFDKGPIRIASGEMTPYEFMGRCEYLFGSDFAKRLAVQLKVSERTVRRWIKDLDEMPGPAAAAIRALWQCKRYGIEIVDCYGQPLDVPI